MTIPLDKRIQQLQLATPVQVPGERIVASPFQFLVTGEDNLRVLGANSIGGVRIHVHGRMLTEQGELLAFAFEMALTSNRQVVEEDFPLGVGFLINVTVFTSHNSVRIGDTFVQAKLIRGLAGATFILGTLLQGYVTQSQEVAWPGTPILSSFEGPGAIKVITGTDPAVGVEISEAVPNGARWELLGFRGVLRTSAIGGNREPVLFLGNGVVQYAVSAVHKEVPISTPATIVWSRGINTSPVGTSLTIAGRLAADTVMLPGHEISTSTIGFDLTGDEWDAPTLLVREWLEAA